VVLEDGPTGACLYGADGRRIEASCLYRTDADLRAGPWQAEETVSDRPIVARIETPVVFGSAFFGHWGHFLLESTARVWASVAEPELARLPWVFTWWFAGGLAANALSFLDAAGVSLLSPTGEPRKCALKRCFVPSPSFAMGGHADPLHLAAPHRVARRLASGAARDPRPVYFSRSGLRPHADSRPTVRNEAELEQALVARGARIVRMETLTLAEQIAVIEAHSVFVGPWGSALHNIVFSLRGSEISTYTLIGGFTPGNFMLVDAIVGNEAHYLATLGRAEDFETSRQVVVDVDATLAYLRRTGAV
jgi:capsular polysaccharide biosynthesis protein